jgi:hypothetical protein
MQGKGMTSAAVRFRIRRREMRKASPKEGMRNKWTEYQVLDGRRVVSRHDTEEQARKWLARRQQ